MTLENNSSFRFEEVGAGMCFMWHEKFFIKTKSEHINAVCLEDGHVYFFENGDAVTVVNATIRID